MIQAVSRVHLGLILTLALALVSGCRSIAGTSPALTPSASDLGSAPATTATAPSPTAAGDGADGISEFEALTIGAPFRSDPNSVLLGAERGAYGELTGTSSGGGPIEADHEVWVVRYDGVYWIGCEYETCPQSGTQSIYLDAVTGELLYLTEQYDE